MKSLCVWGINSSFHRATEPLGARPYRFRAAQEFFVLNGKAKAGIADGCKNW
jgi:hypothetical protein